MTKEKILLIRELGNLRKSKILIGTRRIEQLGLEYLASSLETFGYKSKILIGDISEKKLRTLIEKDKPFAIGFSAYTYTVNKSIRLAKLAKAKAKKMGHEIVVIFGGYHASSCPEDLINIPEINYVILGEGEQTLPELLNAIKDNKETKNIPGIVYKTGDDIIKTLPRSRIKNIDRISVPNRIKKHIVTTKKIELSFPSPNEQKAVAHIIHSRGCHFNCSFCDSRSMWGNKIYFRKPTLVVNEAEDLIRRFGTNYVGFIDLTFNANKTKVVNLCSELIKRDLPLYWHALCRVDLFDKESIEIMAKAKCTKVSIGLESPNIVTARSIKDNYYSKKEKLLNTLNILNSFGIIIKAFLIIGFVHEKKKAIEDYQPEINNLPLDDVRITIATPFPGTKLWKQCQDMNLLSNKPNWDQFTTETLCFKHPHISKNQILDIKRSLIKNFFLSDRYLKHTISKIKAHPHLKNSWIDFLENFKKTKTFNKEKKEIQILTNLINKA